MMAAVNISQNELYSLGPSISFTEYGTNLTDDAVGSLPLPPSLVQRALGAAFLVVVAMVGTVGNILVMASLLKYKYLRRPSNILIGCLCVSDLICCSFLPVTLTVAFITNGRVFGYPKDGVDGNWICKAFGFLMVSTSISSIACMTIIAVNRYTCVCKKSVYNKMFSTRNTYIMGVLVNVYGVAVSSIPFFSFSRYYYLRREQLCLFDKYGSGIYFMIIGFVVAFVVPFPAISFSYFKIWQRIRQARRQIQSTSTTATTSVSPREIAVTRALLLVLVVYIIFLVPHIFATVALPTQDAPFGLGALWFANSAINPIIYGMTNPQFRRAYRRLVYCVACRWLLTGNTTTTVVSISETYTDNHQGKTERS